MKNYILCFAACTALSACGGTGREFVGAIEVDVEETGAVVGLDTAPLSTVSSDVGGFAFGLVSDVDATAFNVNFGQSDGDLASFVVSGVLPEPNVGLAIGGGVATYTGQYAMEVIKGHEDTPNANAWDRESFGGAVTVVVDLHEEGSHLGDPAHGHSHEADEIRMSLAADDGHLVFDDVILFELQFPAQPMTGPFDVSGGTAVIDDVEVSLTSQVYAGQDGVVGAFQGEGPNTLVAGGFVAGN
ncbi:MAG: hypothetical protein AAFQ64_14600 [Pseudomonadota bacterium]